MTPTPENKKLKAVALTFGALLGLAGLVQMGRAIQTLAGSTTVGAISERTGDQAAFERGFWDGFRKSFREGCVSTGLKQMGRSPAAEKAMEGYCDCMVTKVQSSGVVSPDKLRDVAITDLPGFAEKRIGEYMASEQGKADVATCVQAMSGQPAAAGGPAGAPQGEPATQGG